jgi:tetrahydromethanopterin S-methyltransferase subunit G
MDLTKKAKEELEERLEKIENFIAKNGLGSSYLQKAQKTQRDINLLLALGGALTIVGLVLWMKMRDNEE